MPTLPLWKHQEKSSKSSPDIRTRDGFEQVYRAQVATLFETAYYRLRDEAIAKCIVHQVFCSIWERREILVIMEPIEHYLVRAVKLAVMDHIRIEVNRQKHLEKASTAYQHSDLSTESQCSYRELLGRVTDLVDKLPPQRQRVYKLSREKGMNRKEISAVMHIAEKTVEGHLTKALKFLRIQLEEYRR